MAKKDKKLSTSEIARIKSEYNPETEFGGLNALSSKFKISKKQLKEILGIEVGQRVGPKVGLNEAENNKEKEGQKVGLSRANKIKNNTETEEGQRVGLGRANGEKSGIENEVEQTVGLEGDVKNGIEKGIAVSVVMEEDQQVGLQGAATKELQNVNENMRFLSEFINLFDGNIDKLKNTLGIYKDNNSCGSKLEIHLPVDTDSNFKTSIRVNKVVWEMFKEFCSENKQFKQKELISQALLDIINKYK